MRLFAYLDPGTGSIIIQALIGAAVGAAVVVKTYWGRIRTMFGKGKSAPTDKKDDKTKSDKKDLRD
jgi:hypothetical protein